LVINDIPIEEESYDFGLENDSAEYETEDDVLEMEVETESVLQQAVYEEEYAKSIEDNSTSNSINGNGQAVPLRPSGFGFFQQSGVNGNGLPTKNPSVKTVEQPYSTFGEEELEEVPSEDLLQKPKSHRRSSSARRFLVCKICGTSNNIYSKKCKNCGVDL
jgi:hypothetical protein